MRLSRSISGWLLVLICGGCEEERHLPAPASRPAPSQPKEAGIISPSPAQAPGSQVRAFIDMTKQVPAGLEWSKEVMSRRGGTIAFRVDSQGPFGVTVVSGESYKALTAGEKRPLTKADVFLAADSEGPTYAGKVTIPAGSSYIILENRAGKTVNFHLQCFPGT